MAASATTIAMTLVANTMRFDRKMRNSRKRVKGIGDQAKRTGLSLKLMAVPVRALTRALGTLAGGAGAGLALVSITKRAEAFNQEMRSSLAIMGDVSDALRKDMTRAAFDAAAATKFASKDIAGSFFFLASAGLDAQQSIAALPLVAKFAQAGMFDMKRATDLLTDAQSALGLTVKNARQNLTSMTRVADVLVKANTLANASVLQFSEALTNKAGAASKFLKIRLEQTVAVLAAFADQGIKASDAGTAFNIVTRDLTTKAIKNAAAFERMNIAVFDQAGKLNNLADVIRDLENAMDGMNAKQAKATLLQLGFADKSSIFIQTLIGMSNRIREYESELDKAGNTTSRVAAVQLTLMARALAKLESAWTSLGTTISISDRMASSVGRLSVSIRTLNEFMKILGNVTLKSIPPANRAVILLGAWTFAAGSLIKVLPKVWTQLKLINAALKGFAIRMALSKALIGPAGWLQLAGSIAVATVSIGAIVTILDKAADKTEQQRQAAQKLTQATKEVAVATVDFGNSIDRTIGHLREQGREHGKTASQIELQRLATQGATRAQLLLAQQQLKVIDANQRFAKQAQIIDALEEQVRMFGLASREIEIYRLKLADADAFAIQFANNVLDKLDALKQQARAIRTVADVGDMFTSALEDMQNHVAEFNLSPVQRQINALIRDARKLAEETGIKIVIPKAAIEQIRRAAEQLDTLRAKADAFATLKQQALSLVRALRTPREELAETVALLNKMAKTIDPATGKALIDTDTLVRGIQKARDQLRRLKDDVREFAQGKRETTSRLNEVILGNIAKGVAAQRAKNAARGSPLFRQFGPTPPGGILQGGAPNVLGGRAIMRPGQMSGNTVTITRNDQLEDLRVLLDKIVRQGQVVRAA